MLINNLNTPIKMKLQLLASDGGEGSNPQQSPNDNEGNNPQEGTNTDPKTYTQEELDKLLNDAKKDLPSEDELNILVGMVGKKLGAKHVIARVRNPDYSKYGSFFVEQFGFSMIVNPEAETATEILRLITFPNASSIETFAKGKIELVGIKMTEKSNLNGCALHQLRKITRANILICAVRRENEVIIPSGNFVINENDELYITGPHYDISCFCFDIGLMRRRIKNVTIVGGSRIAYYLSTLLEKQDIA